MSDLPESIIHHIMSFLSALDAIRISVLSKKFFCIWISFPILVFNFELFARRLNKSSKEETNLFLNFVQQSLRIRKLNGVCLEKLIFNASLRGFKSDCRVDEMLNYAELNKVRDLSIVDPNFKLWQHQKPYCFRVDHSIFSAKSITNMNLQGFDLKPQDINLNFPSVENFSLTNCCGFRSIELSGPKLKIVQFDSCNGLKKIHIDAPKSLVSFSYGGQWKQCEIDLSPSEGSRWISEGALGAHRIPGFPSNQVPHQMANPYTGGCFKIKRCTPEVASRSKDAVAFFN
ncbi:hypothetical protein FEM48_Zijuj11G0135100 [Ziziphus jujuba var. spinosa]|uniref:F-box domain-containing protein n=1 Tax=Ziziphus jujuba var. spinosa TaxID=714518 RepID=A0A978UJ77_ZIZJJ|nr:hypothetical protein FEM48_Zijuj11G0135100 [Ziziphus jujuba var. spinosa]